MFFRFFLATMNFPVSAVEFLVAFCFDWGQMGVAQDEAARGNRRFSSLPPFSQGAVLGNSIFLSPGKWLLCLLMCVLCPGACSMGPPLGADQFEQMGSLGATCSVDVPLEFKAGIPRCSFRFWEGELDGFHRFSGVFHAPPLFIREARSSLFRKVTYVHGRVSPKKCVWGGTTRKLQEFIDLQEQWGGATLPNVIRMNQPVEYNSPP